MSLGGPSEIHYGYGEERLRKLIADADADREAAATAGGLARRRARGLARRWRERRQRRRADAHERQIHTRENLRNYRPYSGDGGGLTV